MDQPLFRIEAIEARRNGARGDPLLLHPVSTTAFALIAAALLGGIALAIVTVEVPRRVTVRGYLAPDGGIQRVRAPGGGAVAEWFVAEGATVDAGAPLLRVEDTRSTRDARTAAVEVKAEFQALRDDLVVQRQLAVRSHALDGARTDARLQALAQEADALERRLRHARGRQLEAAGRAAELAAIARAGHLPRAQWQQQQDRAAELADEVLQLEQQRLERTRARADLEAERDARDQALAQRMAELDAAAARLALEAREAETRVDAVLRAPVAGRVLRLPVRPGAALQPGQVAALIAPAGAPLRAVLMVPSRDAGLVVPGQPVVLRVDAYPYQRFGVRRATVLKVSAAVVLPGEAEAPVAVGEPSFEVVAELERDALEAYGQRWPLRADLGVEADVVLERITLLDRLLDPLRAATRRSG